ncbi:hypothetical protein PTTG_30225 [Puccinia triticina 1-1 BBBD Race 1]|uniref:Uncharacterized protein n=1 Tax=Puccinia triticina (isolate 1-1 / race 1 (BBBD)) TaxID=630390 RepID=A0A180FZM7_PUCT1|nr:hypothetical protein PTTG_30225 [Puccinia triticina 1-1 BBBD Race 1]
MEKYKKKTLRELRELQHTHIKYKKLNQAIKTEAENLYFEYQKKQHLLSLKYNRPSALLTKYLGQRRTRQQESCWDSFRKNDPDAQEALHNTENNIGQRNKEVSKLYKQDTSTNNPKESRETDSQADATNTSDAAERGVFNKIFKSSEKLRAETRSWAEGVQQQLKEFSDLFGMEGFLVLAGQDHQNPFFFQGGSINGDDFLKGLIDEGDQMRSLALNHKYICCKLREIYEEVQTSSKKKDTRGWPGTNTAFQLANFDRKLDKRKASKINEEEEDGNDGEDQAGNTEDKGDDEEVYGEDDNE